MNATAVQMEKLFIPYIFERYLGENNKSVLEHFLERGETKEKKSFDLKKEIKEWVSSIVTALVIVFVLKGFFEYRKTVAFDSEENKFPQEDAFSGSVPFSSSS